LFKVQLDFRLQTQSWSESYWSRNTTTFAGTVTAATRLANKRSALLGHGASISAVRISTDDTLRFIQYLDTQTFTGEGSFPGVVGDPAWSSDQANACIVVRCNGGSAGKFIYLAGYPDCMSVISNDNETGLEVVTQWVTPWAQFRAELVAAWSFRRKANTGTLPVVAFVSNTNFPGLVGLVTAAPIGAVVGSRVQARGFRRTNPNAKDVNGEWQIAGIIPPVAPATQYEYFLANSSAIDPTVFSTKGVLEVLAFAYSSIAEPITMERIGTRKRGESLGARRGRSPIRR
jgi:hypothetical protein